MKGSVCCVCVCVCKCTTSYSGTQMYTVYCSIGSSLYHVSVASSIITTCTAVSLTYCICHPHPEVSIYIRVQCLLKVKYCPPEVERQ